MMSSLRVISLGWGVQSWTLAAMAALGEVQADIAIHSDTTWEKQATYEFVQQWQPWLESRGLRVVTVKQSNPIVNSGGDTYLPVHVYGNGNHGRLGRQCTKYWKIMPMRRWMSSELSRRRIAKNPGSVELLLGISLDEWQRMKVSNVKWIENSFPLVDMRMTRADCVAWLQKHDLPAPPKSACVFCPLTSLSAWREQKRTGGQDWEISLSVDKQIRNVRDGYEFFLTSRLEPLDSAIVIPEDSGYSQLDMFDDSAGCDSGYCFV